jgi:hypothetical protein
VNPSGQHFDDFSTSWTLLKQAHEGPDEDRARAQTLLVQRYRGIVHRYLAGALRRCVAKGLGQEPNIAEAVDECEQQCWLRLVQGRFSAVSPDKGGFRNYLKVVLGNLVKDRLSAQKRAPEGLGERDPEEQVSDDEYRMMYRHELLERAMQRMHSQDEKSGQHFHAVLQAFRDHPDDSSDDLARRLSQPGLERTAVWVRTTLFRARRRLGELVRQEVAVDLGSSAPEAVDAELAELGLASQLPD